MIAHLKSLGTSTELSGSFWASCFYVIQNFTTLKTCEQYKSRDKMSQFLLWQHYYQKIVLRKC